MIINAAPAFSQVKAYLCGAEGTRTPDPLVANEVRYQLRYSPMGQIAPGDPRHVKAALSRR